MVSEKEFEYGADAFEAYQKEGKVKPDMVKNDVADIKSKSRQKMMYGYSLVND